MLTDFVSSWFPKRTQPRLHVREFRQWDELQTQQESWKILYKQTPAANFFQSWEWFECFWRHFGNQQKLRMLTVEDLSGEVIGLVPLILQTQGSPLGDVRRLGFPLDNWGTQYSPLGAQPLQTLAAALAYLYDKPSEWDVIDLRWVARELCPVMISAWRAAGMHFQQKLWSRSERINLSQGWDAYWAERSSKWRNNQRRSDKALAKLGNVRIEHFRPDPGSENSRLDLWEKCRQVATSSWQASCQVGNTLSHPEVRSFLQDAHVAAAKSGAIHLSLLFIDERPAAFTYNYVVNGTVSGLRTGYDPEFHAAGPGAVLMRETIRECCLRGDLLFDLGESPSAYKRHWANLPFESFRFCHYSSANPLAAALRFKGWLRSLSAS